VPILRDGIVHWGDARHHRASFGAAFLEWHVMVLAMMLPTIAPQARAVALRSLARRRHLAIAEFLVSYLVPWSAIGLLAAAPHDAPWGRSPWAVTGLCAIATAWAILPWRERSMMMVHGHAPVLAPEGWAAVQDGARSGVVVGAWCVASCWPAMLACAFSGHHLATIVAGGGISLVESRSFRPPKAFVVLVSAALTAFFALR
jgi:predicted metal-binding membrane protein